MPLSFCVLEIVESKFIKFFFGAFSGWSVEPPWFGDECSEPAAAAEPPWSGGECSEPATLFWV